MKPTFFCCTVEGTGMDGIAVQQQLERHFSRRDGSRQNDPDDRADCLPDGEETRQRTLSHHCPSVVSNTLRMTPVTF